MANKNNRFARGTGCYNCESCGRKTRESRNDNCRLCNECFDIAGIENEVQDGYKTVGEVRDEVIALMASCTAKGGKPEFMFSLEVEPATPAAEPVEPNLEAMTEVVTNWHGEFRCTPTAKKEALALGKVKLVADIAAGYDGTENKHFTTKTHWYTFPVVELAVIHADMFRNGGRQ